MLRRTERGAVGVTSARWRRGTGGGFKAPRCERLAEAGVDGQACEGKEVFMGDAHGGGGRERWGTGSPASKDRGGGGLRRIPHPHAQTHTHTYPQPPRHCARNAKRDRSHTAHTPRARLACDGDRVARVPVVALSQVIAGKPGDGAQGRRCQRAATVNGYCDRGGAAGRGEERGWGGDIKSGCDGGRGRWHVLPEPTAAPDQHMLTQTHTVAVAAPVHAQRAHTHARALHLKQYAVPDCASRSQVGRENVQGPSCRSVEPYRSKASTMVRTDSPANTKPA